MNESWPWIANYMNRKRLRALGFTDDLHSLNAYEADMLLAVDDAVQTMRAKEYERKTKSKK